MQSVLLRVELCGVSPLVWRRLRIPARWTLRQVHEAIQVAFGWEDRHLHEFEVGGLRVGMPDADEESSDLHDDTEWTLREVLATATKEFLYVYDFGDQWEHRIVVEPESRTGAGRLLVPLCLAGENAAPPEDVGGPPGYAEFVAALADPEDERHEEFLTWLGGVFDAEGFDLNHVNRELRRLRKG